MRQSFNVVEACFKPRMSGSDSSGFKCDKFMVDYSESEDFFGTTRGHMLNIGLWRMGYEERIKKTRL